ncbi:MAG: DUF58 domain-containing protein [Chloroflexi bacterium]|jgi:uncharacterized protein (DUF58 family)|nr:DUF58 domain-containing protein [Chloroflexota bacterium]
MTINLSDLHLAERGDPGRERREARQRLLRSALRGDEYDPVDVARSRGLVLREREDSIFSDSWVMVALLVLLVGFFAGRNPALLALGLVLLIIVGVSTVWKNLALTRVTYKRSFDRDHVFPGEAVEMTISVANDKSLPLTWLRINDELPVSPDTDNVISQTSTNVTGKYNLINSYSMHARERVNRVVTLQFPARGYYTLGPVTYKSGDVFTLFTIERAHNYQSTIVVYPEIETLDELGLPAKEPFGELKIRRSLFTDPIKTRGIRDYQPQDRFRDVHWKATARRGELQTKIYDPSTGMTLAVFLNVATMPRHWLGFYPELLEKVISVAASMANYGVEQGWGVGVYANGSYPGSDQPIRVPPGRSPSQLTHILEALAAVTEFATASIDVMMLRESPRLPWVSTIVLVTAVITDEIMVALARLQEAGRRVVLLSLADDSPAADVGQILTYHIASGVPAFEHQNQPVETGRRDGNGAHPLGVRQ